MYTGNKSGPLNTSQFWSAHSFSLLIHNANNADTRTEVSQVWQYLKTEVKNLGLKSQVFIFKLYLMKTGMKYLKLSN